MKRLFLGLLVGVISAGCNSPERTTAGKKRVLASELGERCEVIGQLGVPLGTAVLIEGKIVAEVDSRQKVRESHYVLCVHGVAGRLLPKPVQMDFDCHPCAGRCERQIGPFTRAGALQNKTAKHLSDDDIKLFNEKQAGEVLRLLAYETGCFSGTPNNPTPNDMPLWQDFGWAFFTWLEVLDVK